MAGSSSFGGSSQSHHNAARVELGLAGSAPTGHGMRPATPADVGVGAGRGPAGADVVRKIEPHGLQSGSEDGASGATGLERRRGPGRRLSAFLKSAEEGELTPEQFLFLMAIETFKKANGRPYPAWSDVLEVVRLLGYRKTCASELTLANAEDWTEAADAPSAVRPARWHERSAKDAARRDDGTDGSPARKAA